jgi:hypothetical protein
MSPITFEYNFINNGKIFNEKTVFIEPRCKIFNEFICIYEDISWKKREYFINLEKCVSFSASCYTFNQNLPEFNSKAIINVCNFDILHCYFNDICEICGIDFDISNIINKIEDKIEFLWINPKHVIKYEIVKNLSLLPIRIYY